MQNDEVWELFDTITSAWFGKMMYAQEDDGRIYSRYSGWHMTFAAAVEEFCDLIGEEM